MKKKLAICVPYRDTGDGVRKAHLDEFVPYMDKYLSDRGYDFKIFISHQVDDKEFNRSRTKNIAFLEAVKEGYEYFAFHDIDMLPEDADYSFPFKYPVHIATSLSQWDYTLRDIEYFGGCVIFTKEQFERVNGYYNDYWGWGMEDDDLFWRVYKKGMANEVSIKGPGYVPLAKFTSKSYIQIDSSRSIRSITDKGGRIQALIRPEMPDQDYLIGDNGKYIHYPIISRPGYDFRIAYDNSKAFSATMWSWKNDLYYLWMKQYPNRWAKIDLVIDATDKSIRFFTNDNEPNTKTGTGSESPLYYNERLKRYGGSPYYIGGDGIDNRFLGDIAVLKFWDHRGNLVIHYDFSECDDHLMLDKSGYGNHGKTHHIWLGHETIDTLYDTAIPHRREGRFKCLPHPDEGIVNGKFVKEVTARNERIYRLEVQKDQVDFLKGGVRSMKYELVSKTSIYNKHVMLNVKV